MYHKHHILYKFQFITFLFIISVGTHTLFANFSPNDIPNCQLFFVDGKGIQTNNSYVTQWNNQVNETHHATQMTPKRRPVISYESWPGHTTILSEQHKEFLRIPTFSTPSHDEFSILIVGKAFDVKNSISLFGNFLKEGTNCSGWKICISKINSLLFFSGTPEQEKLNLATIEPNQALAIGLQYKNGQIQAWTSRSQTPKIKKLKPLINNSQNLLIGGDYKNKNTVRVLGKTEMATVLYYDRFINDNEMKRLWKWAKEKYPSAFQLGFQVHGFQPNKFLPVSSPLHLNFTMALAPDTKFPKVFLNELSGSEISGKWTLKEQSLTFHPSTALPPSSLIVMDLFHGIKSREGNIYDNKNFRYFSHITESTSQLETDLHHIKTLKTTNEGQHNIPMTLRTPIRTDAKAPVLFWVHGGGWSGGSATESYASEGQFASYLSSQLGIAVVGTAYRCKGSKGNFAQAMEDLHDAVLWIRKHADEYQLDTSKMAFAGGSAGTPLASLMAQQIPEAKCFVGLNGIYDFVNNEGSSFGGGNGYGQQTPSPEHNSAIFNIKSPPPYTLLIHGDADTTILPFQSLNFAQALKNQGGEVKCIIYKGESHAFFSGSKQMSPPVLFEFYRACKIGLCN